MPIHQHLERRNGRYHFRIRVPADLRATLARGELRYYLGTSDPAIARRRARLAAIAVHKGFDLARRSPMLTAQELLRYAGEYFIRLMHEDDEDRRRFAEAKSVPTNREAEARHGSLFDFQKSHRPKNLEAIEHFLEANDFQVVIDDMAAFGKRDGLDIPPGGNSHHILGQFLLRALREATRHQIRLDQGNSDNHFEDELVETGARLFARTLSQGAGPASQEKSGVLLSEALERFLEQHAGLADKTKNDYRTTIRLLTQELGDKAVRTITPEEIVAFKNLLLRVPVNYRTRFKTEDLRDAIARAGDAERDYECLSPKTINNKHLSNLRTFFAWAIPEQLMAEPNPASGVRAPEKSKKKKASQERDPFSVSQLNAIFHSPLFSGCKSASRVAEPGEYRVRDHRYWAPLLGLFTGARLNELGQLRVSDVETREGISWIRITEVGEPGEDRRVKTESARRVVPVAEELRRLGFPDYVESRRRALARAKETDGPLFPAWRKGEDGYYSSPFSKFFSRFLRKISVKTDRTCFHSFRHTAKNGMRALGLPTDLQNRIIGHADETVQSRYGSELPLLEEAERFMRINYPGLDLSHLYPSGRDAAEPSRTGQEASIP